MTYVAGAKDSKYEWQATNLIRSVSLFSARPIVVVVYGESFAPPLEWREHPCVIVYRMRPIAGRVSFNFNKIRSMVGARTLVGVQLDTDQIVFQGVDDLFAGTRLESTSQYPWPLLPVHSMSRDYHPQSPYKVYAFTAYKGKHTMRWGHAHPTWSFWALAFLCDLLLERYRVEQRITEMQAWNLLEAADRGLMEVLRSGARMQVERKVQPQAWMVEDEDMLNVNLWRDGAQKAWCKFDLEPSLYLMRYAVEEW